MLELLKEMKKNSGIELSEAEISQSKTMSAESRLIGSFANLLRDLKFIQADAVRHPHYYGGGCGAMSNISTPEKEENEKIVDMPELYKIALSKLEIIKKEINKTFNLKVDSDGDYDDDDEEDNEDE